MMYSEEKKGIDFFSICLSVFNVFKDMYSKNVLIDNIKFVYFSRQRQKGNTILGCPENRYCKRKFKTGKPTRHSF